MANSPVIQPFLKWVGGKRQLIGDIIPLIPSTYNTYMEPFLGGGAVLLTLQPSKIIANDLNGDLINVYITIRDHLETLLGYLEQHKAQNSIDYFYKIRELDRDISYKNLNKIEKAARIIYLNKTCYNGLYRVNLAGQFNAPYGKYKNPNIVNEPVLRAVSAYLNQKDLVLSNEDYKTCLMKACPGDFVYLDPPYIPISTSSSFTGYTEGGFNMTAQEQLRDICLELHKKGVQFLLSNSDCPPVRELYREFHIVTVKAKRSINSKAHLRGEIDEVLVKNYP